jgi:hypothetical protein
MYDINAFLSVIAFAFSWRVCVFTVSAIFVNITGSKAGLLKMGRFYLEQSPYLYTFKEPSLCHLAGQYDK